MIVLGQSAPNRFGESYFKEINNLAFENSSSEDVLEPHYQEYLDEEEALYIVVGTDSGLLHKYIKSKVHHKYVQFVFIDFDNVIEAIDFSEEDKTWKGQVRLANQHFDFRLLNIEFGSYVVRRKIYLIKSLAVMDAKPGSPYYELWDQIEVAFINYCRAEFNTQSHKVFEEQRILNAADNWVPAVEIDKCLVGRDAIVLGGGPTLDDAIEWIREHQNQLIIFAAARIAKRLEREGILADFFVTVDPFPWNFDNSKSVLSFSEYSILAHSFHAQHRLLSQWNGLSVYMGEKYGWYDPETKPNIDTLGPTVTNSALHLACTLGAERVFLSGIDFCFAKGQTHESSSDEAKHGDKVAHHGKAVLEDNAGQMTETGDDFYSAKIAMEDMIRFYLSKKQIDFVSLGYHSAKMDNVTYVPHEDVQLNSQSKEDLITDIKLQITLSPEEKRIHAEETLNTLNRQHKRFKKLVELSDESLDVVEKIYGKKDQLVVKQAEKIKKLQKKVLHAIGKDGDFLASYQAAIFADAHKPVEDQNAMTPEEVKEQLSAFFGGVNKVSKEFDALIKKGLERTNLRLIELDSESLPSKCYEQWQKWQEFGRALQWKTWHGHDLPSSELETLEKAIDDFQEEFEKTDHQYQKMLQQNITNVSKILMRANNAFAQKNNDEIHSIIEHVEDLESQNEQQKQDFIRLLNGMSLELEGKLVEAFNVYEPIDLASLKHLALKKMLPIAIELEDYDAAMIVLERMVKINLDYMVPYADMLALLNNKAGAIEVLNMYLNRHPDKPSVRNKLAQLYFDMNQPEAAEQHLQKVLQIDPDNKTAMHLLNGSN